MRKAMIVWGGWSGHDPDLCASMMRGWLKQEGFEVRIETSTEAFADPAIHDLSLIVPIYTMSKIEKPEALNLCAAVRAGVGLAGHHGGMCDAFRESVDYQFLCGGQWVAHPGNIIDYTVSVARRDDPVKSSLPVEVDPIKTARLGGAVLERQLDLAARRAVRGCVRNDHRNIGGSAIAVVATIPRNLAPIRWPEPTRSGQCYDQRYGSREHDSIIVQARRPR